MDGISFWRNVNKLIKAQNTTQEAIAKTCAINFGTFKNRSSKKIVPDAIEAYKIAQALNTTVEYLVTGEDTSPYKQELDKLKAAIIPVLDL
jgi:transcriptional regulator, XRE family